jgi:hypothetical protein
MACRASSEKVIPPVLGKEINMNNFLNKSGDWNANRHSLFFIYFSHLTSAYRALPLRHVQRGYIQAESAIDRFNKMRFGERR